MESHLPSDPHPDEPVELTPELRDYMVACIRAACPSASRHAALRLLGERYDELEDSWELPLGPVDWDEIDAEARRQGCTAADVIYDRAGRRPRY